MPAQEGRHVGRDRWRSFRGREDGFDPHPVRMFDSRKLEQGDEFVLAYNHRGPTVPPDRIVRVTEVTKLSFSYKIQKIWVESREDFIDTHTIRKLRLLSFREGRSVKHGDFDINMANRSCWIGEWERPER